VADFILDENAVVILISMLSLIPKESEKWMDVKNGRMDGWKKKTRKEHFPVLEKHLVEWVYRAQLARVPTSDDVLLVIARQLADHLSEMMAETLDENYSGFELLSR
jgi:hypothetical protein